MPRKAAGTEVGPCQAIVQVHQGIPRRAPSAKTHGRRTKKSRLPSACRAKTAGRKKQPLDHSVQQPNKWRGPSEQILLHSVGCEARKRPAVADVFFLDFSFYRTYQAVRCCTQATTRSIKPGADFHQK